MVHVGALPGTPKSALSVGQLAATAAAEAALLAESGFDAIVIENMHDAPYIDGVQSPEITAAMAVVASAIRRELPELHVGIQVLSRGTREAIAIAHATELQFVRCENFVFAHIADEGLMPQAEAGPLLRYRRMLGAHNVAIYTDIDKKHASHAITADCSIAEWAQAAAFFGSDGLIVTGRATGQHADLADVRSAREATSLPVLVGSGVTPETLEETLVFADAVIVGSWFKQGGLWHNPPDAGRVRAMASAHKALRRDKK